MTHNEGLPWQIRKKETKRVTFEAEYPHTCEAMEIEILNPFK
jgi:hypothetical protein